MDTQLGRLLSRLRRRARDDRGVGMVTALGISFTVLALSTTWYALAIHEIEESAFDEHRTMAVNAAEAGLREAMHRLANESAFRTDATTVAGATAGTTSGDCSLVPISSDVDGVTTQLGEYWYRAVKVNPADPDDLRFLIDGYGWSPAHDRKQTVARQVRMEVELIPNGGGFFYALFAADGGLNAGNRKEIYGDIYTGENLTLSNYTRVYPNDSGYVGTGAINVYGDLSITGGSNVEAWGDVRVNGFIDDQKTGSHYLADVITLHDNPTTSYTETYFKNATVDGTFFTQGPASEVSGNLTAGTEVYNATGLTPVQDISLPTFTWDPLDYSPPGVTYATWGDFDAWYSANSGALSGAHYVTDTGPYTLDLGGAYLTDDFILAFDGDLTVKKTPSGSDLAPATIVLVGVQTTSKITLAQSSNSIEDVVHHLIVSYGEFAASQQSTIYGALYGEEDTSSNRIEIHFRPPNTDAVTGFEFDPALADNFIPQPWTWREIPPEVDATGVQNGASYHCTLP